MAAKVKFTSPFGVARYPHITKPDTEGQYADNKYKTKLVLPIDSPEAKAFIKLIEDAAKTLDRGSPKMYRPYDIDEDAGEVVFKFKTQYAPAIFDSYNRNLNGKKDAVVGGGSVIRLCGQLVAYDKGITAQFNQVQVRELTSFGASAFDTVEGGFSGADYEEAGDGVESSFDEDGADGTPRSSLDL